MAPNPTGSPETGEHATPQHQLQLHRVLASARARLRRRDFVRGASLGAAIGMAAALLLIVAQRLLGAGLPLVELVIATIVATPLLFGALAIGRRKVDEFSAAIEVERHHHLKERLSSALFVEKSAPADCPRELVDLIISDGESHASQVDVRAAIPIVIPRSGRATVGLAALVALTWILLPTMDLFGREQQRQEVAREAERVKKEDERLRVRAAEIAKIAERHAISEDTKRLLADLQKPRTLPRERDPKEGIRRPLAELEELTERAKELQSRKQFQGLDEFVRAMQGIDERMETELGRRAEQAMSEGSPQRASEALEKLAEQLSKSADGLTPKDLESLSRDLQKLAAAMGGKFPELSKDLEDALKNLQSGDAKGAGKMVGASAEELARLARLMKESDLLDSIQSEIEFTQDELAQLPKEWKSGPPPKICPDCLKGT